MDARYSHLDDDEDDELANQLQRDSAAASAAAANPSPGSVDARHHADGARYNGTQRAPQLSIGAMKGSQHMAPNDTPISAIVPNSALEMPVSYFPFTPTDRALPGPPYRDDNFDDAYATFILYCNPRVSVNTDTTELKTSFRSPPRSDGKSFNTFTLFELIRQLERKELKTWTQLAIKLGVEPPQVEKNQSTQKVQQYSVRLKRWMRAMHIDAFFEFCQGKTHIYFTNIPPPDLDDNDIPRDNVPPTEDLAIRALRPDSRPKRGRRKTEEKDDHAGRSAKKPHLDTSVANRPYDNDHTPIYPTSGLSNNSTEEQYADAAEGWTNGRPPSQTSGSQQYRLKNPSDTPSTPHPGSSSAIPFDDAPLSAVDSPRGRGRPRKRHGPAVSSAWSGGAASPSGKTRGRPPQNKTYRDGPFSAFPARPNSGAGTGQGSPDDASPPNQQQVTPAQSPNGPPSKPSALQVQVPQRRGGPVVRLSTPTVLVNGESAPSSRSLPPNNPHPTPTSTLTPSTASTSQLRTPSTANTPSMAPPASTTSSHPLSHAQSYAPSPALTPSSATSSAAPPAFIPTDADLERTLIIRLLTADPAFDIDEAKMLSRATLATIRRPAPRALDGSPGRPSRLSMDTWGGLMKEISVPEGSGGGSSSTPPSSSNSKTGGGGRASSPSRANFSIARRHSANPNVRVYDVGWTVGEGCFEMSYTVSGVEIATSFSEQTEAAKRGPQQQQHQHREGDGEGENEKMSHDQLLRKVKMLEDQIRREDRENKAMKARVLGAVL